MQLFGETFNGNMDFIHKDMSFILRMHIYSPSALQEWWIVETSEQYSTVSSRFSSNYVPTIVKILKI